MFLIINLLKFCKFRKLNVSDKSRNNKIETVKMPWKWYIKSLWRVAYIHIIENISEETMRPVNHLLNQSLVPCDPINKQNSLLYRCFIDKEIKASYENRFDKNLMVESGIWIESVNWGMRIEGSLIIEQVTVYQQNRDLLKNDGNSVFAFAVLFSEDLTLLLRVG